MKATSILLTVLLCLLTLLWGCRQTTTVILPPDNPNLTTSNTATDSLTTETPMDIEPSTTAALEPEVPPTAEPTAAQDSEAATVFTSDPVTEPLDVPTEPPITQPTLPPAIEPSISPTTDPVTEPEPDQHPVYYISGHQIGALEYALLDSINSKREDTDVPPLALDPTLCALARIRAYECTESFSHSRPDGRSAYSVLTDYSYGFWSNFSQQIHYGSAGMSAGTIVKGWMYNAGFSEDISSADYSHMGIGVYNMDGLTYIVCFFAA